MMFNLRNYGHLLMSDFLAAGGHFVRTEFHEPGELARLPQKAVINCPGYAARDLWRDKSIIPVRGQTGWLLPQPEAHYGFNYKNASVLSKGDGVVVMHTSFELGDMEGVGNSLELPDRNSILEGLALLAPMADRLRQA